MRRWGGDWGVPHLTEFGTGAGSEHIRGLAEVVRACVCMWWIASGRGLMCSLTFRFAAPQAQKYGPVLKSHDKFGNQVSQAEFHPAYHELMAFGINNQVPSFAWNNAGKAGSHVIRAALGYLQYQVGAQLHH